MNNTIRITVELDNEQYKYLKLLSLDTDLTMKQLIYGMVEDDMLKNDDFIKKHYLLIYKQ